MTFAHPAFLWAFAGLAIPLAIHLLSRKEGKVIRVGSLRHVEESNTSQFKSIRLNEIWLLLIRCLVVAMIVLFMSGAQCSGLLNKNIKWVVAERGINVDSLVSKGYEFHMMPEGNYWTYVEELNKLPYDILVISHSYVDNFHGKRVSINDNIKWVTTESTSKQYDAFAWTAGDSVYVRTGRSDEMITAYTTRVGVPDSIEVIEPRKKMLFVFDSTDKTEMNAFFAAINVLRSEYKLDIQDSIVDLNKSITLYPPVSGDQYTIFFTHRPGPLIEQISPAEIYINKHLDQDIALNDNLVIELFKVLYPELQKPEVDKDVRVLPDELAFSKANSVALGVTPVNAGIEKYLIALFLLVLAIERFLAIRKNQ